MSDFTDLYDLIELSQTGGYQGNELLFYDFETGTVHKPFAQKRNVVYGRPVFADRFLYFLQGDYDSKIVTLYRYLPGSILENVTELDMEEINLYNLMIVGDPIHIISQGDEDDFHCYYPEKILFPLGENESVILIADDKVYLEKWIEEGWDEENDCRTDQYKYYNEIVVRDFTGKLIEKFTGSFYRHTDGSWWIA